MSRKSIHESREHPVSGYATTSACEELSAAMACPSGALLLIPKRRRIGWRSVMRIGRSLGRWRLSKRNHHAGRLVEGDNDSLGLLPTAEIANPH
jgi:hypothetical protein